MKRKKMYRIVGGKRVHVNFLASQSRVHTVNNSTITNVKRDSKIYTVPWNTITNRLTRFNVGKNMAGLSYLMDEKGNLTPIDYSWKNPKGGYKQPKSMMKKHTELVYNKETHITEKVTVTSTFPTKKFNDYQKSLWKNMGLAAKMKAYEDEKVKKWERKHPKPCPDDDLFKDEMIPAWNQAREQAIERIRDFVVSMFDKLPLTGRYKESDSKFVEKPVTELKDKDGEGHMINDLNPKKSKLLNKAQKVTNKEKAKNAKLVATNLKDHKRKKGRMILPDAA